MDWSYFREKPDTVPSQTIIFEPPKKVNFSYYRCDNKFQLDTILEMYEDENKIGICLISGKELLLYIITQSGTHVDYKLVKKIDITLPNKHSRGGSSSNRFARIVKTVRSNYVTIIVENIIKCYMTNNNTQCCVSKLVLAGPADMKNEVANSQEFIQYFSKYLHKIISTNNFDDNTIHEIVHDIIPEIEQNNIKIIENEINELIQTNCDNLVFGKTECLDTISQSNIKKIYIDKELINNTEKEILEQHNFFEIICISSELIKLYGGWLGVKQY
mgnify:CR=1 FL=1